MKKHRDLRPKKPGCSISAKPFLRAFFDAQRNEKHLLSSGEVGRILVDLDRSMPYYRFWTGSLIVYELSNKLSSGEFNYRTPSKLCWKLAIPPAHADALNTALIIDPSSYSLECIGNTICIKLAPDARIRTIPLPLNGYTMLNVEGDIVFSAFKGTYSVEIEAQKRYLGPLALEFDESYQKVRLLADVDCEAPLITITS